MQIADLMDEKIKLRQHQLLIRFLGTAQARGWYCGDRFAKRLVFLQLGIERRLAIIPEPRVGVGQGRTVAIATEIGGGDRVLVEVINEIPVAKLSECAGQQYRRGWWRRRRRRTRFDVAQDAKCGGRDAGALDERSSIHFSQLWR